MRYERRSRRTISRAVLAAVTTVLLLPVTWALTSVAAHGVAVLVANPDSYSTNEDTLLSVDAPGVLGNDTDINITPAATAVLDQDVAHGALTLNADGSFSYTPSANFNGADVFTYHMVDGTDTSSPATVTITVDPVNDPPVAGNDSYRTNVGTALVVAAPGVLGNDTDVEGDTLTVASHTDPTHGSLTINSDGSFTYTPDTTPSAFQGVDSFTYKANDGTADSNSATVTITVDAAPVAVNDSYDATEDTALSVPAGTGVLANDTDADNDTLTAAVVAAPTHAASFTLNSDGSFTYTPAANYNGPDSFTYKANDGFLDSNVATVTITVASVNDAPVAVADSFVASPNQNNGYDAPGVLANDTDVDGDTLTVASHTNTAHGFLFVNPDGAFSYTPFTNFTGDDSFTYTATDGTATSAPATVTIHVNPIPGDDLEQYIRGVYQVILLRAPDPGALTYWRAQLTGGLDPLTFTNFLERSTESSNLLVTFSYAVILGRGPDAGGLAYWSNQLANGLTLQQLEAVLAGSDEFFARNGGTNFTVVAQMYRLFLGREADSSGLAYWTALLNGGTPRGAVVAALLASDEGIHRLLELTYQNDLQRSVDPGGETYWRSFLQSGDLRVVFAVLPASYEFALLVTRG